VVPACPVNGLNSNTVGMTVKLCVALWLLWSIALMAWTPVVESSTWMTATKPPVESVVIATGLAFGLLAELYASRVLSKYILIWEFAAKPLPVTFTVLPTLAEAG